MRRPLLALTALLAHAAACGARNEIPTEPTRSEVCNGVDDNGDGVLDEGIPPQRCGVGACAREVPGCVDGRAPTCEPGAPSPEVCNGLDDDCDGTADDGLGFGVIAGPHTVWDAPGDAVVWGTVLVPVSGGMLALMQDPGIGPDPTVHVRKLDANGVPAGPEQLLPLAPTFIVPGATPSVSGGAVIAYCALSGALDGTTSVARLGADGSVEVGDVAVAPAGKSCGGGPPGVHWSGAVHVVGWGDRGSAEAPTAKIRVGALGSDLSVLGGSVIEPEGDWAVPPRFAQVGESVGMVYGLRRLPEPTVAEVAFQRLSPAGEIVGERAVVGIPAGAPGEWQWQHVGLVPEAQGLLMLGTGRLPPDTNFVGPRLFRARFGVDGSIVEPPTEIKGFGNTILNLATAARPTGGTVGVGWMGTAESVGGRVFLLDADGELAYLWTSEGQLDFVYPSVYAAPDGRIFVLSVNHAGGSHSAEVREFGCML